ncbi:hypothetical protein [Marinitenerispora sediminis]|uniref:Uncharacterized protein n=1 Tax=Marinitenerispora sediminis TaxID=1931232 RepID=A0A368T0C9_9ACTN|nr:hypothetical protein [Marinitenerispora sediminis]RCV49820.1 hypothetical protein DEF23_23045 [Marinitenerispora sediminis]RCV52606.1 hypothetical protein DEF24_21740 [Marinitenerispora sediminis]RCV57300.1 hypothetical protein DEF28_02110 [Marinitenerispora sediminis]
MNSNLDTRLHDHVALAEIELYSELLTVVATAEGRLTVEEIDEALGVAREPDPESRPPARNRGKQRRRRRRKSRR